MKVEIVYITPVLAQQWLKANKSNRPSRERQIAAFAKDMKEGKWATTHQGIAFDDGGRLIDGQHRLKAIVKSGCTIQMMVTRGLPAERKGIKTIDTIDQGAVRTVANQLQLSHGIKNAAQTAATLQVIAGIACAGKKPRMTVATALALLNVLGDSVKIGAVRSEVPQLRKTAILGSLAFAHYYFPLKIDAFVTKYVTGEQLSAGDPALALRNLAITLGSSTLEIQERRSLTGYTISAAAATIRGLPVTRLRALAADADFFIESDPVKSAALLDVVA